ncbi:coiled-coil domain-containing protein [Paenibacillus pini]|uniref:N-terminal domain of peptidoglycan hydrolase CwlO-containing protein n=1 Tax=Paenibacillus pini JCM 16418 TaxID=1236976 RepID=W7YF12_9BACL|nr:hypothetical protein [Paenibacillus pini]GAF07067.1 hypothetical protein JCM16418_1055 [Paenibacillus pini JCM 16418]
MKDRDRHLLTKSLLLPLLLVSLLLLGSPLDADPATSIDSNQHDLLQNSLSIVEIDHEIERITKQQATAEASRNALQKDLVSKSNQIKAKQDSAGAIVRSYYMGERDNLFTLLLSASNISNFLQIYSYYEMIIDQDATILDTYQTDYHKIQAMEDEMQRTVAELDMMRMNLIKQRERVLALQKEVDSSLAGSANPEALKKMIEEFTLYWNNIGIYEVKKYFEALASAMQDLPDFIKNKEGTLRTNGSTYTIDIHEDDLNLFLRSKNEIFNQFSFHFANNSITASGKSGTLSLEVKGHYSVENEPQNSIMFHVDKLVFNGLELPDTTCRTLEEEFDLGFYPQKIVSFVKATEVKSTDKHLIVILKLSM